MVSNPSWEKEKGCQQNLNSNQSKVSPNGVKEEKLASQTNCDQKDFHGHGDQNHSLSDEPRTPVRNEATMSEEQSHSPETTVWIRCDVYDTGIGIPGML